MPMPFCTQCGHHNPTDAKFCSQCGTALVTAAAPAEPAGDATSTMAMVREEPERAEREDGGDLATADQAAVDALPARRALLGVLRGPNAGSRFLLNTDVGSAGRHPESDIVLDDVAVSPCNAEARRSSNGL